MRFRAKTAVLCGLRGLCVAVALLASSACGVGSRFFHQYEYEEEMYLSLDGSATVYLNSSIPALDALRGVSYDTSPTSPIDREAIRAYFTSPNTHVTWVRPSRRNGRRFVHVRLEVDDVRKLGDAAPFSWSSYRFTRDADQYVYLQAIGKPSVREVGNVGWTGREIVAFRLHLPSKIESQNTGEAPRRGNILVWEQSMTDRLRGEPLTLEARMQTKSILYTALWLFGATFVVVAVGFGLLVWWVFRRGTRNTAEHV